MLSPSFASLGGFTGICLKISQRNPVVEAARRAVPSPTVPRALAGSSWIFFFLPQIATTFFYLGFGAGREKKPVPEALHTLLPVGKEGEFLHPSSPSALFPAPDKEGVSSPEPGAGLCRWPISARVTQPLPVDVAVAQPQGHKRAEGEAEPVFPYGSLCLGKFSLHFV